VPQPGWQVSRLRIWTFFFLADTSQQDYRFIDASAYPKLGYVAPRPDLVISHLRDVSIGVVPDSITGVQLQGMAGQSRASKSSLEIRLAAADAEALETFSAAHVGKRIVFMLGDKPLFAPLLRTPLSSQVIQINPPAEADVQELKRELEALISKPT
jgi:preprotein translocase subunit SecD